MTSLSPRGILLALDGGSAVVSVAVGGPDQVLAARSVPADRSSATLLRLVDACLVDAGIAVSDLGGLVALRGPGSFTGLRVTLAICQGLEQALGLAVGTLSTFEVLAHQVEPSRPALAVVRAGRGSWNAQRFGTGPSRQAIGDTARLSTADLRSPGWSSLSRPPVVVGFGIDALGLDADSVGALAAKPLAPDALALAEAASWDPTTLTEPIYLSPPPTDRSALRGTPEGPSEPSSS